MGGISPKRAWERQAGPERSRRALGVTLASLEMLAPFRDTTLISGDGRPGLVRAGPEDVSVRLVTAGIGVSILLAVSVGSQ